MTIKAGHLAFIIMILFWFYFTGLSNTIIRKQYLVTGDWRQSKQDGEGVGSVQWSADRLAIVY